MANILIADDEVDILSLLEKMLTLFGYNVIGKAHNGREVVEIYKKLQNNPDIVLLDYIMPILNGLDAAKELLAFHPNCNIIMITAHDGIEAIASKIGIKYVLKKPFNYKGLNGVIKRILSKKIPSIYTKSSVPEGNSVLFKTNS